MMMTTHSFHLRIAILSLAILSVVFIAGCKPPKSGGGQPPNDIPISIQNPQWGIGQGTPANWQMNNDANHKVRVKVQTLDANQNATLYRSYQWTYNYSGLSDTWHNERIEVPQTGMFVVQVEVLFTECTWQNMTSCSFPIKASNKEYFTQATFSSRPPSITMPVNNSHKINEECVCQ
jgi:hypothetical protein